MPNGNLAAGSVAEQVNSYVREHPGCSRHDLTEQFGHTARHLTSLLADDTRNLVIDSRSVGTRHSDQDMITALQEIARKADGPLSRKNYNALAESGMPAGESIMVRFGSWSLACERAGVRPGATPRRSYGRTWDNEEILRWVHRYLQQETESASLARYESWVKDTKGGPAGSTIRVRFGRWSTAYAQALQLSQQGITTNAQ